MVAYLLHYREPHASPSPESRFPMHSHLRPFDKKLDAYIAVIEAVRGTRNKFKFDERKKLFIHNGVLPAGQSSPFDFGFIPGTKADDGDPADILLLMDEPAYVGAVIPFRL